MPASTTPGNEQKNAAGNVPDRINSLFEATGGVFLLMHVLRAYHDKSVAGVSIPAVTFFAIWGYWNLYYYRSINQRFSLVASSLVTVMNTIWLILLIHYKFGVL